MKRIVIASVVMMLLVALAAQAQTTPPPPGPEHKKLGIWIGTWTGEAKDEATPFRKAATSKNTTSCAWFTGEYQVVCNTDYSGTMGKGKVLYVLGYSVEKKQYFGFFAASTGESDMIPGKLDGSSWTFENSATMGGKTYQFRTVFKFASPNENTSKSEYSEDGKSWKLMGEGKGTKK